MTNRIRSALLAYFACALVSGAALAQPSAPHMRLVQDFRIDGTKEEIGNLLGGVFVLPSGKLVIADWYHFQLRFYDGAGKHVTDFGSEGRASGRFSSVRTSLGPRADFSGGTVGDSVWAFDRTPERVTVVSAQGKLLHADAIPAALSWKQSPSAVPATELHNFRLLAVYGDGSMLGQGTRGTHDEMVLVSKSGTQRTLAVVPHDSGRITVALSNGGTSTARIPFTGEVLPSVAQDGNRFAFVATHQATSAAGGTWSLTVISATGDTVLARKYPYTGMTIPAEMVDNALRGTAPTMDRPAGYGQPQRLDSLSAGEVKRKLRGAAPAMRSPLTQIHIGLDNTIWLMLNDSRVLKQDSRLIMFDSARALVLDTKGNPYAEIALPKGRVLRVSHSNVWMKESSKDGSSIVRYHIQPM